MQASCQLTALSRPVPDPVRYQVDLREPAGPRVVESRLHCDRAIGTVHERLTVPDYAALFTEFSFVFEPVRESRGGRYFALQESQPVVVVSFTPA